MIKTTFVILLVVFLIVIMSPGSFQGSVDLPVELPKKEVAKIQLQEDRMKEYAYLIKDVEILERPRWAQKTLSSCLY